MVKKHKILGLVVDENLTWASHIHSLCLILSSLNGLLYRTRDFLSYEMNLSFYNWLGRLTVQPYCAQVHSR